VSCCCSIRTPRLSSRSLGRLCRTAIRSDADTSFATMALFHSRAIVTVETQAVERCCAAADAELWSRKGAYCSETSSFDSRLPSAGGASSRTSLLSGCCLPQKASRRAQRFQKVSP
jgi:hypothetical protein